jgi:hypothetical protein
VVPEDALVFAPGSVSAKVPSERTTFNPARSSASSGRYIFPFTTIAGVLEGLPFTISFSDASAAKATPSNTNPARIFFHALFLWFTRLKSWLDFSRIREGEFGSNPSAVWPI